MLQTKQYYKTQQHPTNSSDVQELAFTYENTLWRKSKPLKDLSNLEVSAKRYEYCKIGKTFGLEITRYLSLCNGLLLYFSNQTEKEFLGYCNLENVYAQWTCLDQSKYTMTLFNGNQKTLFYFNEPTFWEQQREEIAKYVIQLNFSQKYQILQKIGEGSYSLVYHVRSFLTGQCYAAKVIPKIDKKDISTKHMVQSERRILNLMQNQKGVASFIQFFQNQDNYILIIQYIPGVDMMTLFQKQRQQNLPRLKKIFISILRTIKECHTRNIIHRDIKPQNIIINPINQQPKLIDFGLALITNLDIETNCYYKCGTIGYIAPEVLLTDSQYYKSYSYKCDIFSFGIVAHMFMMGYNPLTGKCIEQTTKNSKDAIKLNQQDIRARYGEAGLVFLQRLLSANHKLRYTAEEALNSIFLRDYAQNDQTLSKIESIVKIFNAETEK